MTDPTQETTMTPTPTGPMEVTDEMVQAAGKRLMEYGYYALHDNGFLIRSALEAALLAAAPGKQGEHMNNITPFDETESVMRDMVAEGLMEQRVVIATDGTTETRYRLTSTGLDDARSLILRLTDETGDDQGDTPDVSKDGGQ